MDPAIWENKGLDDWTDEKLRFSHLTSWPLSASVRASKEYRRYPLYATVYILD